MQITIDTKQRIQTSFIFVIEFYKIMMGTFLIAFVPQNCDETACTIMENIQSNDTLHTSANIMNLLTFLIVLNLYRVELLRENWCIKYLDIDETKPNNNLDTEIEEYKEIKTSMRKLNYSYLTNIYISLLFLFVNFTLSSVSISMNYYNISTVTSLFSFFILVTSKIFTAYTIAKESYDKEHACSAYMKTPKTYNVIDADYSNNKDNNNNSKNDNKNDNIKIMEITENNNKDVNTNMNEFNEDEIVLPILNTSSITNNNENNNNNNNIVSDNQVMVVI